MQKGETWSQLITVEAGTLGCAKAGASVGKALMEDVTYRSERSAFCLPFFFFFCNSDTHARTHLTIDLASSHTLIHHTLGHTQAYFIVGQRSTGAAIIAVPEQQRTKRSGSVAVTERQLASGNPALRGCIL